MQIFRVHFNAMACGCEIAIASADETTAHKLAQSAINEVKRIEVKFSRYRADSIVSKINAQAGGEALECDDETCSLLDYADALYQASDNLFDITSGILRRGWDFKKQRVPDADELRALCACVGWSKVERNGKHVRLPVEGMEIDFGGFGKEYAVDRAAEAMIAQGVDSGFVNLGGDIRVLGPKPDGQAWVMGIQDPRNKDKLVASIPLIEGALATSGDYEKYFEDKGRRYCHILNPATGMPVQHWRSISVLAPLASLAGSCTTIAMLKDEDALAYLDATDMRYLAIDQKGDLFMNASR